MQTLTFWLFLTILPYIPVNCDKELPLVQFYNVVKHLNLTNVYGRSCETKSWTGNDGTKYITMKTPNVNNDDDKLCDHMFGYMNQQGALDGANWNCTIDGELVVMNLMGVPDPNYDPSEPNEPVKLPPLVELGNLLDKYPKADLGGCPCCPVVKRTSTGVENIEIFCYLAVPKPYSEACDDILAYLNQNNWLDESYHECKTHYPSFFSLTLKVKN